MLTDEELKSSLGALLHLCNRLRGSQATRAFVQLLNDELDVASKPTAPASSFREFKGRWADLESDDDVA